MKEVNNQLADMLSGKATKKAVQVERLKFSFEESSFDFIIEIFKCLLMLVCSFGLLIPYVRHRLRIFIFEGAFINGQNIRYLGNVSELYKGTALFGAIILILYNLKILTTRLSPLIAEYAMYGFFGLLLILLPFLHYINHSYLCSRIMWRNRRLQVLKSGILIHAFLFYFYFAFFFLCTLTTKINSYVGSFFAVYAFFLFTIKLRQNLWANTYFAGIPFSYEGNIFSEMIFMFIVLLGSFLSLGILIPFFYAKYIQFQVSNWKFNGNSFKTEISGFDMYPNFFVYILTSSITGGLIAPFILSYNFSYLLNSFSYEGEIQLDSGGTSKNNAGIEATITDEFLTFDFGI